MRAAGAVVAWCTLCWRERGPHTEPGLWPVWSVSLPWLGTEQRTLRLTASRPSGLLRGLRTRKPHTLGGSSRGQCFEVGRWGPGVTSLMENDLFLVLSCRSVDVLCIWLGIHFAIFLPLTKQLPKYASWAEFETSIILWFMRL